MKQFAKVFLTINEKPQKAMLLDLNSQAGFAQLDATIKFAIVNQFPINITFRDEDEKQS